MSANAQLQGMFDSYLDLTLPNIEDKYLRPPIKDFEKMIGISYNKVS